MDPPPPLSDISDDLQSMSFNSTAATDIHRSASSSSETTTNYTASTSSSFNALFRTPIPKPQLCDPTCRYSTRCLSLSFSDIRFLRRIGSGDIGSVYLSELKQPGNSTSTSGSGSGKRPALFAAKVMDKEELERRNKEGRARTEREIVEMLEHPFLPTLYAAIDSPKWSCLLTEFCPGGDLHVLRQRHPFKRFPESAVRFYASEVVVALEYLHMMGIVYRDLKPENVLVRADGHIMLTDFDLSLKCDDSQSTPAQVISAQNPLNTPRLNEFSINPPKFAATSCILPNCIVPAVSCFKPKRKQKKKSARDNKPEVVAEPVDVRSMSFVGTHEYLAPEIVFGEGHGSAVDWWTLGIFIFELFYGVTPFRGIDHELTLANIGARALEFPKEPSIPSAAKDLISQLLVKDPTKRLGSMMGASAIKNHPFFQGVNWALLRCTTPPFVPPQLSKDVLSSDGSCQDTPVDYY